jgi:hypothetical protein
MTTKVVYNACFGGFGLSHKAIMRYAELKGIKLYPFTSGLGFPSGEPQPASENEVKTAFVVHYCTTEKYSEEHYWSCRELKRTDLLLVQVVEELGNEASGKHSKLKIAFVPKGVHYRIDEYDGSESVMEQSDYKWETA